MIKKTHDQKLSEALKNFAAQDKLKDKLLATKLMTIWKELYPGLIADHTEEIRIKQNSAVIKVSSASLRHELQMNKTKILQQLNEQLGEQTISIIEFR